MLKKKHLKLLEHLRDYIIPSKAYNNYMSDYLIPGWNDVVQDEHVSARDAFREWILFGKPEAGSLFTSMKDNSCLIHIGTSLL